MKYFKPKEYEGCQYCPMFVEGIPVIDRMPEGAWGGLSIIGEMPGRQEVKDGQVFVGQSGKILDGLQQQLKLPPVHVTNAIKCGLRQGAKPGKAMMKEAVRCCRQLTVNNLKVLGTKVALCVGGTALEAMMSLKGIEKYRGCCWESTEEEPWITSCTIHPAGLLHQDARRIWIELLRDDLQKASKLATGAIELWEPTIKNAANVDELLAFLYHAQDSGIALAVDVETDGIDALTCNLRTVGVAAEGVAYSIPWAEWYPEFFTPEDWKDIRIALAMLFADPEAVLVFQNKIYDVPVLERYFGPILAQREDTLLLHHALYPKLPHDLQALTAQFIPCPPWKSEYTEAGSKWGKSEETEEETAALLWYNGADAAATIELYDIMKPQLPNLNVAAVYTCDKEMMDISIDWYKRGLLIDMDAVNELSLNYHNAAGDGILDKLQASVASYAREAGLDDFNPNSPKQLQDLLFKRLKLPPIAITNSGQTSTDKDTLLTLYDRHPFIPVLLAYRKHSKLYSTYIKGLHTKLHDDGRLHSIGSITSTPSGRFGFKPAVQNWPKAMRKLMIAPPECVYIGADFAAIELRLFALLAGEKKLIDMFNNDVDVHAVHAEAFFGDVYRNADAAGKKQLRSAGKPVTFGKNYGAGPDALFRQIREERMDDDPKELLREVTHMSNVLDAMYPMLMAARDYWVAEGNRQRNLRTFMTRRLRKFPFGGVSITVAANHPIQGGASDIANAGTIKWVRELKAAGAYWKTCWPTIQTHDFLGAEVLVEHAEEEMERLERCMYMEITHTSAVSKSTNTMKFPAMCNRWEDNGKGLCKGCNKPRGEHTSKGYCLGRSVYDV